jgi:hypothetical protein
MGSSLLAEVDDASDQEGLPVPLPAIFFCSHCHPRSLFRAADIAAAI